MNESRRLEEALGEHDRAKALYRRATQTHGAKSLLWYKRFKPSRNLESPL